jgi:hypothetical protein
MNQLPWKAILGFVFTFAGGLAAQLTTQTPITAAAWVRTVCLAAVAALGVYFVPKGRAVTQMGRRSRRRRSARKAAPVTPPPDDAPLDR